MDSSSLEPRLAFGIEMELLVQPKAVMLPRLIENGWNSDVSFSTKEEAQKQNNRNALHKALAVILTQGEILATTDEAGWSDWTITDERSLDEVPGFCKLQIQ